MAQHEKYRVLRKIDAGGMAEVFQGVAEGIEGFAKKVAIKRVLPHLVENKKFIAMFLDEARLSLRMTHANVVQVFDIGQAGGTYFIVMEFVDGTNLKKIMDTLQKNRTILPVEQSVFMMMEVCRGLSYAHQLSDSKGNNLGLVHRDVSPPNILLSKQGEVKIVDFGLAKATSQLETTDPGVVKGKFAYLSPEAAWGKEVDKRADVFACGIVLYELLTAQRLFLGNNDVNTIELVRAARVPTVMQYNPHVKPELERILRKSLAADVSQRYQSCDAFAEDMASYLFAERLKVTSFDIRRSIEQVIKEQEKDQVTKPSIIDRLIQDEMGKFSSIDGKQAKDSPELAKVPGMGGGNQPLNPFRFEESGGFEGELASDAPNSPLPAGRAGRWRESGLFPRDQAPPSTQRPGYGGSMSLEQMLEGGTKIAHQERVGDYLDEEDEEDERSSFLFGVVIAVAVVTVVIGAAWAMGLIP